MIRNMHGRAGMLVKKNRSVLSRISAIIAIVLGIVSVGYAVMDAFNLTNKLPWLKGNTQNLILLLLSSVVVFLISDYFSSIRTTEDKVIQLSDEQIPSSVERIEKLITHAQEFQAIVFKDILELEQYQIQEMEKCSKEILDLTWSCRRSDRHKAEKDKKVDQKYEATIDEVSKRVVYKEVFVFNAEGRKEKLERRLSANRPAYSCAYYEDPKIPLLQFMVLDGHIVIFASSRYGTKFAIENGEIAEMFVAYYNDVWDNATKIKSGKDIDQKVLAMIREESSKTEVDVSA